MASASADAADSENPPVQLAVAAADTTTNFASNPVPSLQGASSARSEGSCDQASQLASFPAPSTAQIRETASVERTQGLPRAGDTPAPQEDSGYARPDPADVSATPAHVGSGGTSNTDSQETESPSTEVSPIRLSAVAHSSSSIADTSEKK